MVGYLKTNNKSIQENNNSSRQIFGGLHPLLILFSIYFRFHLAIKINSCFVSGKSFCTLFLQTKICVIYLLSTFH